jgi:hypothetical protein
VVPIRQLGFISRFTKSIKKYLLQPFVVGFAVALGMSFGTCPLPALHDIQSNREILLPVRPPLFPPSSHRLLSVRRHRVSGGYLLEELAHWHSTQIQTPVNYYASIHSFCFFNIYLIQQKRKMEVSEEAAIIIDNGEHSPLAHCATHARISLPR